MKKILITGATGLVGSRLTELLVQRGCIVHALGRKQLNTERQQPNERVLSFYWDIEKQKIDAKALEGVDAIIHLAGAGVAEKKWSTERKREIIDSRVKSAQLLFNYLKQHKHHVKTFISASAVGYYGDCGHKVLDETQPNGGGFLAEVCQQWENAVMQFSTLGIREVRCRIGIVLTKGGGALPELTKTIPLGIAAYFSKTDLYYSWIHIDDVCGILIHALENEILNGAYNTTAPTPLLMKDLMTAIVNAHKSRALVLPAPPLAIRLAMGEQAEMLLSSQRCNAEKIIASGYVFQYSTISKALKAIYG